MDRKIKTKIIKVVKQKELELKSAKIERELIKSFNHYVKTSILAEIYALDDSTQLINVINIGERFQNICESIGSAPEYKKMFNFLSDVRMKDREISRLVNSMKNKYKFNNPDKFRVKHEIIPDNLDFILQSLKSQLKSLQQEEEEIILAKQQKKEEKEKAKLEKKQDRQNYLNLDVNSYILKLKNSPSVKKAEFWAQTKFHPEEIEENKLIIKNFRKNLTQEKKEKIQKDLTSKEERTLLKKLINEFHETIIEFESFGNYVHIVDFSNAFLKFCESLDEKFRKNSEFKGKTRELRSDLRKFYKFLEDWLNRVEIKYEDPQKRNQKEEKVEKNDIDEFLKKYEIDRSEFIIVQENRRILKYLLNQDKEKQKLLKEKEKEEKMKKNDLIKKEKKIIKEKENIKAKEEKKKIKMMKEKESIEAKEEKRKKNDSLKKKNKVMKEKDSIETNEEEKEK